jgi:WD40 repeat protein
VKSIVFSKDSRLLAAGYESGKVVIFDLICEEILHQFSAHDEDVQSLAFSLDGKKLASAGGKSIKIWSMESGEVRGLLRINLMMCIQLPFPPMVAP